MKKEIVCTTQISVKGILTKDTHEERRVTLKGVIARCTERKLLGFMPLKPTYKYEITAMETVRPTVMTKIGEFERPLCDTKNLTFESRKRLAEERQNLEAWLRNKCNEYKKKYGTRR